MTIRQELKRRALRAMVGLVSGLAVGGSLLTGTIASFDRLERTYHPRADSVWLPLALVASLMAASATIVAGPLYAYLMGRNVCCKSTWPVLNLGRGLDRMKCCPYCGRSLDDELPAKGPHKKSGAKDDVWDDELA